MPKPKYYRKQRTIIPLFQFFIPVLHTFIILMVKKKKRMMEQMTPQLLRRILDDFSSTSGIVHLCAALSSALRTATFPVATIHIISADRNLANMISTSPTKPSKKSLGRFCTPFPWLFVPIDPAKKMPLNKLNRRQHKEG